MKGKVDGDYIFAVLSTLYIEGYIYKIHYLEGRSLRREGL